VAAAVMALRWPVQNDATTSIAPERTVARGGICTAHAQGVGPPESAALRFVA
jgi:hypothetical protein